MRRILGAVMLTSGAIGVAVMAMIGHWTNVAALHTWHGVGMAINTAVAFVFLGTSQLLLISLLMTSPRGKAHLKS